MGDNEEAYITDFINRAKSGYLSLFINLADNFKSTNLLDNIKMLKEFHTSKSTDNFDKNKLNLAIALLLTELDNMTKKLEFSTHIISGVIMGMNKLITELLDNVTDEEVFESFVNAKSIGNVLQDIIELLETDPLSADKIEELAIRASTRTAMEVRRILKEGVNTMEDTSLTVTEDANSSSTLPVIINKKSSGMIFPIFDNDLAALEEKLRNEGWVELG